LQGILKQEIAWFDTINPGELSARIGKEVFAIQRALGEKIGIILLAVGMTIAGFSFAFIKGWLFSLILIASFPPLVVMMAIITKVMMSGFLQNMQSYGQSAGYADQAINAIKIVQAFGMEKSEIINYNTYLTKAKAAGIKSNLKGSIAVAFFFIIIYGTYSYAFYIGSLLVSEGVINPTTNKFYSAGDVISVFFGILFGMMSLGMISPNLKVVSEG